jgi:hypothetical protein
LGDGIDKFLDFKDTSDENIANAKSLLLQLMEKHFDCFELMSDGDQETDENKSQDEVTKEEKSWKRKMRRQTH